MGIGALSSLVWGAGNFFQPTVVVGKSMEPTLKSGRVIWVDKTYYLTNRPKRGEVVVFRHNGETYIKRVYRAPGETFYYFSNGGEWLAPVRESRINDIRAMTSRMPMKYGLDKMRVPDDSVFVMGDNAAMSEDSRELGPIPLKEIIGRAHLPIDTTTALPYEVAPRAHHSRKERATPEG